MAITFIDNAPLNNLIEVDGKLINLKRQKVWANFLQQIVSVVNGLLGSTGYVISHVSTLRTYDVNTVTTAQLANTLGTLIADLQGKGILS